MDRCNEYRWPPPPLPLPQVNGQRHSTRRPPPALTSTRQPFDPARFHFGRAPAAERLFRLCGPETVPEDHRTNQEDHRTTEEDHEPDDWVVINVSPIGRSHVLLVPRLSQLLPQRLERRGLLLMLRCLLLSRDRSVTPPTCLLLSRDRSVTPPCCSVGTGQ